MPILFACQKIQKAPAGSRRIIAVGAFFEVLYIPPEAPEPEAPEAPAKAKAWPQRHPPSGDYAYICERVEPDGSFSYPQEGLTIPGPDHPRAWRVPTWQPWLVLQKLREPWHRGRRVEPGDLGVSGP